MAIRLPPFELKNVCGKGGMAEVWRGVHVEQRIPVAVKVMTGDQARSERFQEAFQNEVRAVARLHHPSIVTVLDFGVISEEAAAQAEGRLQAGSPFLAMEYSGGGTLGRLKNPLSFQAISEILLALLDALAHAHARGVLHRDIKPQNVLLPGRGDLRRTLKLTDFGIAHPLEGDRAVDNEDESSGTPQFMAPEQFFAKWRDYGPWTDLYALGCVAYGLASGALPFNGRSYATLAVQHIKEDVPPLKTEHKMPPGFEDWIYRLLEKSPRARFQRAADASWALAQIAQDISPPKGGSEGPTWLDLGGPPHVPEAIETLVTHLPAEAVGSTLPWAAKTLTTDAWRELQQKTSKRETAPEATVHRIPPMSPSWRREVEDPAPLRLLGAGLGLYGLRSVPLVDRNAERDSIWDAVRRTRESGRAQAVILLGASGNGKSRVAQWMGQRAHELGAATIMRGVHDAHAAPSESIAAMLSKHLRCNGLERGKTAERLEHLLRGLGETAPDTWLGLTELFHPSHKDAETALRLESATERHVLIRRILDRLSIERPLILWLDDAQWGSDALALALFILQTQAEAPVPVTFLMTVRDDLLTERAVEAELLEQLRALPSSVTLELGPLAPSDHRELVAELLGLSGEVAEQVAMRTNGNPLFAVQLVGDWVQRGVLELGEEGFVLAEDEQAELPDDLFSVWSRRIDAILAEETPDARIALELASTLGSEVDGAEWRAVCKRAGVRFPQRLISELLRRRLLQEIDGGWAFAHGMLRESLHRFMREADRFAAAHQACAEALTHLYGADSPSMGERIAHHHLAAGQADRAIAPLQARVDARIATGEYGEADALLEVHQRALAAAQVADEDPRWGEHWILRARSLTNRGLFEPAEKWLQRAEVAARRNHWKAVLADALWERGWIAYENKDQSTGLDLFERARQIFHHIEDQRGVARALRGIGDCRYRLGNLRGAAHRYREALALLTAAGEVTESLACYWGLGYVEMWQDELDAAHKTFTDQLAMAETAGNRHYMARALSGLAEVCRMRGEYEEAEARYRRAIELFEAIGSNEVDAGALNLGLTFVGRGDYQTAFSFAESMRPHFERRNDPLKLGHLGLLLLPHLAKTDAWEVWDRRLEEVERMVTEHRMADGDVALTVQIAGSVAADRDPDRAVRAFELALGQWRGLRRQDKVEEIEQRVAELRKDRDTSAE